MEKKLVAMAGAAFMPVFELLYGVDKTAKSFMLAIALFIILDWLAGVRAAKKDKSYGSRYGLDGLFRSFFILLLPAGGHMLDNVFGLEGIVFGLFAIGILYHHAQSMTANAIRAGWGDHFPQWILNPLLQWVRSELEQKIARATGRQVENKGDGTE
ncbi:phage holin family protein [Paenibacillus aurantiacus]|uniref:Phage holin family protein n=1 Tax=Paenibacillus aurantiacus TaxID=1936118 RepID=A0ABV5KP51_9BACL